ncbi:unnamed protein product, partial [Cuscuta campestris]
MAAADLSRSSIVFVELCSDRRVLT